MDSNPLVVLLEVVNALSGLEFLLQSRLSIKRETAEVVIDLLLELRKVVVVETFQQLSNGEEHASDMEACHSSLEANFAAGIFHDELFALVLDVGVVELRDFKNNPESLAVKLLLKVSIEQVLHAVLLTDKNVGKQVSEGGVVVFDALVRLFDELLELGIKHLLSFRGQFDEQTEQAEEINETADGLDGDVLALINHLDHVGDDQLWHDSEDHVSSEGLAGAADREEAHCLFEQMNQSFSWFDMLNVVFVLLLLFVEDVVLDIIRLTFSKVERKPVSEFVSIKGSAHLLFGEGLQAKQVE